MSACLACVNFNTVGQGRSCFSLKLLTNNHKLNVFGSFLVHPDLKDFKVCSLLVSFWWHYCPLTFKLIAGEVSAAT